MTTTHDLTAAAAAIGRYQSLNVILDHLFTDDERADVVRAMVRRYLPGMPVPDQVPDIDPGHYQGGLRLHALTCTSRPSHQGPCLEGGEPVHHPGCGWDTDHDGRCWVPDGWDDMRQLADLAARRRAAGDDKPAGCGRCLRCESGIGGCMNEPADDEDGPATVDSPEEPSPALWHVLRIPGLYRPDGHPTAAQPFAACQTPDGPVVYWRYQA